MGKKRLMKLIITASAIAGGIGFSGNVASAAENNVDRETTAELSKSFNESNTSSVKGKIINVNSSLRVRSAASLESEVIGSLQKDQEISILAEEGTWYKFAFNGKEAYVSKDYVQKEGTAASGQGEASVTISREKSVGQGTVKNVTNTLNVRSGAGTSYGVIGSLRNGDTFQILGKSGEWYNIKKDGITGYISGQYVQESSENANSGNTNPGSTSGTEQSANGQGKVVNVTNTLNIRSGAGTSHGVVGTLRNGDTFTIVGNSGSWYHINKDGVTGYVSGEYVQEVSGNANSGNANSGSTSGTEQSANGQGKVVNVTNTLNIRSGAGTSHGVVGSLKNGDTFTIVGKSGSWYHINKDGVTGYVSGEYVQEVSGNANSGNTNSGSTSGTEQSANSQGKVVNVTHTLNIRSGAGTSHGVVGSLRNGDTFTIVGKSGSWYHINKDGVTGYVSGEYVQEISGNSNSGNTNSGSTSGTEQSANGQGKVVNVTHTLNIRSGAGTNHGVVGSLRNGDTFTIVGKSGSWYHINKGGVTGYVSGEYVQEVSGNANSGNTNSGTASGTEQNASLKGKVINVTHTLNIRSGAGTSYGVVGTLRNGDTFTIVGKSGSWYHINKDGVTGYVSGEYVQEVSGETSTENSTTQGTASPYGQVINITTNLRVRVSPSTSANVLGYLLNNQVVKVKGTSGNWVNIEFNGQNGYVSSDYIKFVDSNNVNNSNTNSGTNSTATFNSVLNVMKAHLGSPYIWGGSGEYLTTASLNALKNTYPVQTAAGSYKRAEGFVNQGYRAFDCSGLMQWGYRQVGINIGRSTWDQVENGVAVSLNDLQPGDLLFYSNLQHVGMYIGNGQWIEAPNSSANVRIVSVPWSKIGKARRIL